MEGGKGWKENWEREGEGWKNWEGREEGHRERGREVAGRSRGEVLPAPKHDILANVPLTTVH